jgi:hypothetical protein
MGVSEIFIKDLNLKQSPARSTMSDGNKIVKRTVAFSNLLEKIRFCLYHYLSLGYVGNEVREGVRKVTLPK